MKELRQKMVDALSADATLTTLAPGGCFYLEAMPGAAYPYLLLQRVAATPTFTGGAVPAAEVSSRWQLKAHATNTATFAGQDRADDIIARARAVLAALTYPATEAALLYLRWEADLPDIPETREQGATVFTAGILLRAETQPL